MHMGQPSLVESLLPETLVERIAEAFDWDRFGRLLARVHSARKGDPATDDGQGVAAGAVVQPLGPPDGGGAPGPESFRRFVGLGLQDDTPDIRRSAGSTLEELGMRDPVHGGGSSGDWS